MEPEEAKERVLQRLESDLTSADLQWSLFIAALESYRHDSILRPFPSAYVVGDDNKNFQGLVQVCSTVPAFDKLLTETSEKVYAQETWDILDWALDRTFALRSVKKSVLVSYNFRDNYFCYY
ncbi:hypothetical protein pdam_00020081 [Pocillopora damicornis]|uniref:PARP16 N-terminal domain-containing protein n=1 Tax=Pocillopora damicornis TaxID=46731 RepID=A0A3M6UVV4_POCDA|nr:hypothetical protein pdam_00020081 [Pocillopora damicornis]